MLAEANDVIAKAKKEAVAIREEAFNEAKKVADSKLENAKSDLEAKGLSSVLKASKFLKVLA